VATPEGKQENCKNLRETKARCILSAEIMRDEEDGIFRSLYLRSFT